MKITLLTVGKIKEKFYRESIKEFQKRLSRYCTLEIVEVADEKTSEGASAAEEEMVKRKEGERLLKHCREDSYMIALAIEGKQLGSEELSRKMERLFVQGKSHIIFIIGGSLGLHDEVLGKAHMKLSFSKMTFPHQLMRVILLEQIYRSFRIMKGEPYHK